MNRKHLLASIRRWVIFFMVALALSGITAFAVETELKWLLTVLAPANNDLYAWIQLVHRGVATSNEQFPFLAYGYDWLAFAHLVIAIAFIGPLQDPVRNIWIIQFGRIACMLIIPLAFIAGAVRHIPIGWQLIDCSFGVIGLIPLTICYHKIRQLEKLSMELESKTAVAKSPSSVKASFL